PSDTFITSANTISFFGAGLSAFVGKPLIGIPNPVPFRAVSVPGLVSIPYIGPVLFHQDPLVYLSYVLVVGVWWWLSRTRPGLHLRACGESPASAYAVGVKAHAIGCGPTG